MTPSNVKVLDDNNVFTTANLARRIRCAADHGANVINMSLQSKSDCGGDRWGAVRDAVNYAWSKSVVILAAAGNFGDSIEHAPGACPNVVAVAHITQAGILSSSATRGDWSS
jgi:subtilisin family serine protease